MKWLKFRIRRKDKPKNPGQKSKPRQMAEKVFGFEKVDPKRYKKSPKLDEDEVVAALARLETNVNWLKRLFWLLVAGSGVSHFFS